jgi:hypothetical protein
MQAFKMRINRMPLRHCPQHLRLFSSLQVFLPFIETIGI